ncbi:recombinase family protein [Brevundimonas sp.]|uniref:recombinase family protein n=1 Tax=Brevundimonas sp. TaxID=1871086 RepID=UPI0028AC2689|nr:recombinase family protein [Brevundimonas sp.]
MNGKFVTYYRVSRASQGIEGLGMEAQKRAVDAYLNGGQWEVVASFEEVESGGKDDRPEMFKAIAMCKATGAKLLIAKLDRLSRDVHFLSGLEKAGVEFVACDMPTANRFTVHIMAAVAQQEREAISSRTKAALGSIKARIASEGQHVSKKGNVITRLGSSRGIPETMREAATAVRVAKADQHAAKVKPTIEKLRAGGMTLQEVADHLNALGVPTARGAKWSPMTVARAEKRAP